MTIDVPCSVYELHCSLVNTGGNEEYTYDLYTAPEGGIDYEDVHHEGKKVHVEAVGILQGLAATDANDRKKSEREQHFPVSALKKGIDFEFAAARASWKEDEDRIRAKIGDKAGELQSTVRGVVAAAALEVMLKTHDAAECNRYLQAVQEGGVQRLRVSLKDDPSDTKENMDAVLAAILGGESQGRQCEVLELRTEALTAMPAGT